MTFPEPHEGPDGVYGTVPGADGEQFIHAVQPTYERHLSALLESLARATATSDPAVMAAQHAAADRVADRIVEVLADVDPETVCRVGLPLLANVGGMLACGYSPAVTLNVFAMALAKHAGHLPREAE